jgi:D-serine deaminase-like pyridoxal phosphate-dependent protein
METNFYNIDTPALLVEESILLNNIKNKQKLAERNGVKLRPHIKTHKSIYIAKLQQEAGAKGIAAAKISEAEVFADHGFDDIQLAYIIIGDRNIDRLYQLSKRVKKVTCCVDSITGAKRLSDHFFERGSVLDVFIKVDVGYNRTGVAKFNDILELALFVNDLPGLSLKGILTHAGMGYGAKSLDELMIIGNEEGTIMGRFAQKLRKNGIQIDEVSAGSTPTSNFLAQSREITELRCGNYVFHDMIQVSLGSCKISDCALSVLATVISKPSANRVVIDAGSKALNIDKGIVDNDTISGFGYIFGKEATIERLSEEHGIIYHDGERFEIGEKVRIIPNHACTVTNLYDKFYLVNDKQVIRSIDIEARGKSQ